MKEELIHRAIEEEADILVPDRVDLWPVIEKRVAARKHRQQNNATWRWATTIAGLILLTAIFAIVLDLMVPIESATPGSEVDSKKPKQYTLPVKEKGAVTLELTPSPPVQAPIEDALENVRVISVTPEPGSELRGLVTFEIEIGYDLETEPEAELFAGLVTKDGKRIDSEGVRITRGQNNTVSVRFTADTSRLVGENDSTTSLIIYLRSDNERSFLNHLSWGFSEYSWGLESSRLPDEIEFVGQSEHLGVAARSVFVQGSYIYVGVTNGLVILEISDPAHPSIVGRAFLSDVNREPVLDIYVEGDYAYIANWIEGLYVLDVSDPANPRVVGKFKDQMVSGQPEGIHHMVQDVVTVGSNYAYIIEVTCTGSCQEPGLSPSLRVLDVSDPANPTEIGVHEGLSYNLIATLADGYAYLGDPEGHMQILDVSDPNAPVQTATYSARFSGLAVSGDHAYLATPEKMLVLDISDPTAPVEAGFLEYPATWRSWSPRLSVVDNYVYLVDAQYNHARVQIVDVSDPATPREVGFYEDASGVNGTPLYVYDDFAVAGNHIYVVGGGDKVSILRLAAPASNPEPELQCPVTPIQPDFWDYVGPVAGEFPVWLSSRGQVRFSQLGPKVMPPSSGGLQFDEAYMTKTLVFVDQRVEGDLHIAGKQLDGDGVVYFPDSEEMRRENATTLQLLSIPPDSFVISSAHEPSNFPNPPGKAHHGMGVLYTRPGCYQFTASIAEHTVDIVIEILDE